MSLDVHDVLDLLELAIEEREIAKEKREEDKAWDMWLTQLPYMKKFIPFSEFYRKITSPDQVSQRPTEDILSEVEEIRKTAEENRRRANPE